MLVTCSTTASVKRHAEVGGTNVVSRLLLSDKSLHKYLDSVIDINILLNNSPCRECQLHLLKKIIAVKENLSNIQFRLILYFTNLYCGKGARIDEALDRLSRWIMKLVNESFVVIICPIIVSTMVPKPKRLPNKLGTGIEKYDKSCIRDFRKLLKKIELINSTLKVFTSNRLFRKQIPIKMSLFTWRKPQFISFYPDDKENLSYFVLKTATPIVRKKPRKRLTLNS
ncbi:hypothetical protein LOD99_5983 [Oopsacas minuta]|uniref:Uncharacterized protein n=1 Tax=Oopsacas minuta TaxID=111878 RepID=A0AAV7JPH6_9METZ|nr:hypothetical protein LOD99_5983 [Oopsacas minuta]